VREGLERAFVALVDASHRRPVNAPMQVAAALGSLVQRWTGALTTIADSNLLSTSLGRAILDAMQTDPGRCARAFNEAIRIDPRAARPLHEGPDPELPLWRREPDGSRSRVTASHLVAERTDDGGSTRWLPRAFLLSAFMRIGVCDRFVHGTGARRYERVTEAWMRSWLGVDLPPIDIASATLRLPLADQSTERRTPVTVEALRRARWDPESLEGHARGPRKSSMLEAIASQPRRSPEKRVAYRRMLAALADWRQEHAAAIAELGARAEADRAAAADRSIADDRTWPFCYFDDAALDAAFAPLRPAVA